MDRRMTTKSPRRYRRSRLPMPPPDEEVAGAIRAADWLAGRMAVEKTDNGDGTYTYVFKPRD